jgi:hypothetical protein
MSAVQQNVPTASAHPLGQGSSTPGGHYVAYRAQPTKYPLDATLKVLSDINRWRPGTPGDRFYAAVISKRPATIGAAVELGKAAGFKVQEVQNHLRWQFTWGDQLEIAGVGYSVEAKAAPAAAPAKVPAKAKASKAKASA